MTTVINSCSSMAWIHWPHFFIHLPDKNYNFLSISIQLACQNHYTHKEIGRRETWVLQQASIKQNDDWRNSAHCDWHFLLLKSHVFATWFAIVFTISKYCSRYLAPKNQSYWWHCCKNPTQVICLLNILLLIILCEYNGRNIFFHFQFYLLFTTKQQLQRFANYGLSTKSGWLFVSIWRAA